MKKFGKIGSRMVCPRFIEQAVKLPIYYKITLTAFTWKQKLYFKEIDLKFLPNHLDSVPTLSMVLCTLPES